MSDKTLEVFKDVQETSENIFYGELRTMRKYFDFVIVVDFAPFDHLDHVNTV